MPGHELQLIAPRGVNVGPINRVHRVIGIDLGTTNSSIAEIVVTPGEKKLPDIRMIEIRQTTVQGDYFDVLVPSMVALLQNEVVVGKGAKFLRTQMKRRNLEAYRSIFWDCKNDIGTRRTYHRAPEGFRSAKEIAAHVLRHLVASAVEHQSTDIDAAVVTTPASFQASQRNETVEAAHVAGLDLARHGGLLDEPTAAYLAYMFQGGERLSDQFDHAANLLVFDFGGGTCDVAVFRLQPPSFGQRLAIAPLSVSRYCRLGGGDIDRAIVVNVLLPQLKEENQVEDGTFDFDDIEKFVIPSLLEAAEGLKVGLCNEISRRQRLDLDLADLTKTNPGSYPCKFPSGREISLSNPSLNIAQLNAILARFIDEDILTPIESQYYTTCSIFAPIDDALTRANLKASDIEQCLMVGGGSLIPQVAEAVERHLPNAQHLRFQSAEELLTAVARGAALQATSLSMFGQGIVPTIAGDSISIRTARGSTTLVERGANLPHPSDGWCENQSLTVPWTCITEPKQLRIELCDSADKTLFAGKWDLTLVNKGDPLLLRYRIDGNQTFQLELSLADEPDREPFEGVIENPLTSVVNANAKRDKVLELEELMRSGNLSPKAKRATVIQIAELERELGRNERALTLLQRAARQESNTWLYTLMGITCGNMGDTEREQKYYVEAARLDPNYSAPLFNLALAKRRVGANDAAMLYIDKAIAVKRKGPHFVLKATLEEKKKDRSARDESLSSAFDCFEPLPLQNDWELQWYMAGAKLADDSARIKECEAELARREMPPNDLSNEEDLPQIGRNSDIAVRT